MTQSIRKKLIKLQLKLALIVLFISWVFITISDFYTFKNLSLQKYESTAKILSRNLVTCVAFEDKEECRRVLSTLKEEKSIRSAVILDEQNKIFTRFYRGKQTIPQIQYTNTTNDYEFKFIDKFILASYPITENGQIEGRLFLLAEFNMMETFGTRHAQVFIFIVIGSFLIAVFLSMELQKKISGQLGMLLNAMNRIKRDKSYNLRISHDHSWSSIEVKEFQELASSFDSMIEQVEMQDDYLKTQNSNLEKIIEQKVQEMLRTAELASLGEMAGGIAHEINNPLTIITSTNRVMAKLLENDDFDRSMFSELLNNSEETVVRIAKIVTGLRNISRQSADKDISDCCFQEIFKDVFDVAEAKFGSKGIAIIKEYPEELAEFPFRANRIQLSQVLVNLLNNSFDALMEMKISDKWIKIILSVEDGMLSLRVVDRGEGIPLKVREKMFNPFFTTKEIGKGTGIGLSISKSMVEKMAGRFFYDDTVPNTCFVIQFQISEESLKSVS